MAFIASSVSPFSTTTLQSSKACALRGASVVVTAAAPRRVTTQAPRVTPRMAEAESKYPSSSVLGIGEDIPSSLYLIGSVFAFLLGCFSVYQSNLSSPLTPDSVNPQFIVGSLFIPISWGLHVAGFIQLKNNK